MNHVARLLKAVSLSVFCLLLSACGGDTVTPPEPLPGPQLVLDSTFGTAGQVRTKLMQYNEIYAAALQPDGKIVAAGSVSEGLGNTFFGLVRYLPDGSVDATFGEEGSVLTNLQPPDTRDRIAIPYFLVVQEDGKILVGGLRYIDDEFASGLVVVRYTAGGQVDTSFADAGFFSLESLGDSSPDDSEAHDAVLQADGKLVVIGSVRTEREVKALLLRLTPEGQLDATFGTGGISYALPGAPARSIALTEAQTYLVAVGDELVRINQDGTVDDTFAFVQPDDTHEWSGAEEVALQADGKILLVSGEEERYILPEPAPLQPIVQPQTSPVPVLDVVVRRLNADGSADLSFGKGGTAVVDVGGSGSLSDLALQPNGRLALTGRYGFSALRLEPSGVLEASYAEAFESPEVVLVTPENAVIIVGHDSGDEQRSFALAKFLPEATAERR